MVYNIILSSTAEVRKDISGQFHNAICCGDIEERIKVLRSVGQGTKLIHNRSIIYTVPL